MVFFLCSRNFWKFGQGFPSCWAFPGPGLYKYRVICPSARFIEPGIKGLLPVGLLHMFGLSYTKCALAAGYGFGSCAFGGLGCSLGLQSVLILCHNVVISQYLNRKVTIVFITI